MPYVAPMYVTFGLLYGVGFSFMTFAAVIAIADWFPAQLQSRAMAIGLAGTSTGKPIPLSDVLRYSVKIEKANN